VLAFSFLSCTVTALAAVLSTIGAAADRRRRCRWRKPMNLKVERGMWHRDRQASRRSWVPIRLGWTAFGSCLAVAGCSAAPDATTSGGGERVTQTKQAITGASDQSLYVLGKCLDVPGFNDTNGTESPM